MPGMDLLASEPAFAVAIFVCLAGASLGSLLVWGRLPERYKSDETAGVVRLVANIFVVMSSLVLGLMINSAKNTYEEIDRNVHSYATEIIVFDRMLRAYGADTTEARRGMISYVEHLLAPGSTGSESGRVSSRRSEQKLRDVDTGLRALNPSDPDKAQQLDEAIRKLQEVVKLRWVLIEQSEGTIPPPLIIMLVGWLMLILASFGYRAPKNAAVAASFVIASALLAGTIYLILDMDVPFAGPIQISDQPLRRALAEQLLYEAGPDFSPAASP